MGQFIIWCRYRARKLFENKWLFPGNKYRVQKSQKIVINAARHGRQTVTITRGRQQVMCK